MLEVIFLIVLAIVWLVFAAIYDWKTKEIPNWLSFSLIIFAMGVRFFYSLFSGAGFSFFFQGLIGLGIFFVIENLMYYGKIFGGGDAKLLLALGVILPFSSNLFTNLGIFVSFFFLYLLSGSLWGMGASIVIALRNIKSFRKEFKVQLRKNKIFSIGTLVLGILMLVVGIFFDKLFLYLAIFIVLLPLLYVFAKSVEESCMKKAISPKSLREGDWLYEDIKIGKKLIKANWEGLSKKELQILQRTHKLVKIKQGISFGIVFLISFLLLVYVYFINTNLWNSFW